MTDGCCGDAHASDSGGTGRATLTPPSPQPGWRPPPRPPTPRPHSPRLGPLALPPAWRGRARGPHSKRQATRLARRAGTGNPAASGAPWCGRGRARAEGTAGPTLLSPQPLGFAAPRGPAHSLRPRTAPGSGVGWGVGGQEGWTRASLAETDNQTSLDRRLPMPPSFPLASPRWCCVKWAAPLHCRQSSGDRSTSVHCAFGRLEFEKCNIYATLG